MPDLVPILIIVAYQVALFGGVGLGILGRVRAAAWAFFISIIMLDVFVGAFFFAAPWQARLMFLPALVAAAAGTCVLYPRPSTLG
jgi:hypothetical protein